MWVDAQRGALCAIHAVNTMLGSCILREQDIYDVAETLPADTRFRARDNFHMGQMEAVLARLVPGLRMHEGTLHTGASTGAKWADTMAARPQEVQNCDCAVLTILPQYAGVPLAALSETVSHFAAALCVQGTWYMLDSRTPNCAYPLGHNTVSHAVNAQVTFFTYADVEQDGAWPMQRAGRRAEVAADLREALRASRMPRAVHTARTADLPPEPSSSGLQAAPTCDGERDCEHPCAAEAELHRDTRGSRPLRGRTIPFNFVKQFHKCT